MTIFVIISLIVVILIVTGILMLGVYDFFERPYSPWRISDLLIFTGLFAFDLVLVYLLFTLIGWG